MQDAPYREVPIFARDGSVKAKVKVSPEDYDALVSVRWSLNRGYACRDWSVSGVRKTEKMHRRVVGLATGDSRQVDHINRDRLDNRRENLRIVATTAMQLQNRATIVGTSAYRGVSFDTQSNKWSARAQCGPLSFHRTYQDEEEAAAAVAEWRRQHMPYATS